MGPNVVNQSPVKVLMAGLFPVFFPRNDSLFQNVLAIEVFYPINGGNARIRPWPHGETCTGSPSMISLNSPRITCSVPVNADQAPLTCLPAISIQVPSLMPTCTGVLTALPSSSK